MEHVIQILITSGVLALMFFFARKKTIVDLKNGILTLKYSTGVLLVILTVVSLIPLGIGILLLTSFGIKSTSELIICISWLTFFSILGIYIYLRFTKEKIIVEDDLIKAYYPLGKPKILKWKEIDNVEFSEFNKWLILESKEKKIRLSIILTGFPEFCKLAYRKIPYNYRSNELEKALNTTFIA